MDVHVEDIEDEDRRLDKVKRLAKKNAKTLGLLPEGAIEEYAKKGRCLIATADNEFAGYLIWRLPVRHMRAVIVHLCVDDRWRGEGIGRQLVDELKERTRNLRGIGLWCRKDYRAANKAWERYGFVPGTEKPGRGKKETVLQYWYFSHGDPDLFSWAYEQDLEARPVAAIDANVFYGLGPSADVEDEPTRCLTSPWLRDEVRLVLTDEIFTEINRTEDALTRNRRRARAQLFEALPTDHFEVDQMAAELRRLLPGDDPQTRSDRRHLAHAIVAGADFFLTNDAEVLHVRDELWEEFGVQAFEPWQLCRSIDAIVSDASNQPVRLMGSSTVLRRPVAQYDDIGRLADDFVCFELAERGGTFRRHLRSLLSSPENINAELLERQGRRLGLVAIDRSSEGTLRVPLMRLARSRDAFTLGVKVLWEALHTASEGGRRAVVVSDAKIPPRVEACLDAVQFERFGDGHLRFTLSGIWSKEQVRNELSGTLSTNPDWAQAMQQHLAWLDADSQANNWALEGALWPLKLDVSAIPSYIVPIHPAWAAELFDGRLTQPRLLDGRDHLLLSHENAYYSAAKQSGIRAPARILWYVTKESGRPATGAIRACSRLDQVVLAPAKKAYIEFRRLGVYHWRQVLEVAGGDPLGEIMVLRFSHTELLPSPIEWSELARDLRSPVQSPRRIEHDLFLRYYSLARREMTDVE